MKTQIKKIAIKHPAKAGPAPLRGTAHKNRPQGPGKTFHKDGHWIENPNKAAVLMCACGNRYLKTRDRQTKCLRCISQGK